MTPDDGVTSDGDADGASMNLNGSGYETQFVPQEGDEDNLWAVEKILAEQGKRYLLRWAGVDDDEKPWPDSWVPKQDVTDDLIAEWKLKKAAGKANKQKAKKDRKATRVRPPDPDIQPISKGSRASVTSSKSPTKRDKQATASKRSESSSTVGSINFDKLVSETTPHTTVKRKKEKRHEGSDSDQPLMAIPRKRRKVEVEIVQVTPPKPNRRKTITNQESAANVRSQSIDRNPGSSRFKERRHRPPLAEEEEEEEEEPLAEAEEEEEEEPLAEAEEEERDRSGESSQHDQLEQEVDIYDEIPTRSRSSTKPTRLDRSERLSQKLHKPQNADKILDAPKKSSKEIEDEEEERSDVSKSGSRQQATPVLNTKGKRKALTSEGTSHVKKAPPTKKARPRASSSHRSETSASVHSNDDRHSKSDERNAAFETGPSKGVKKKRKRRAFPAQKTIDDVSRTSPSPERLLPGSKGSLSNGHEPLSEVPDAGNLAYSYDHYRDDAIDLSHFSPGPENADGREPGSPKHRPPAVEEDAASVAEEDSHDATSGAADSSWKGTVIPETQLTRDTGSDPDYSQLDKASALADASGSVPNPSTQSDIFVSSQAKLLKPIPMMTPSKFRPHMKVFKPIPVVTPSKFPRHATARDQDTLVINKEFSPIQASDVNISSRMKERESHPAVAVEPEYDTIDVSLPRSQEIQARGLELAEMHRARNNEHANGFASGSNFQRRSLGSILGTRNIGDVSSEPLPDDVLQELENAYVDLDGGSGGTDAVDQDDTQISPRLRTEETEYEDELAEEPNEDAQEHVEEADVESSIELGLSEHDEDIDDIYAEEQETRDQTHTETSSAVSRDDDFPPMTTPRKKYPNILHSHHGLISPSIQTPTRQLNAALGLLNAKSEEISELKTQVIEGEDRRRLLLERISKLEADNTWLSSPKRQSSRPSTPERETETQIEMDALMQEKEGAWTQERGGLLAEINLLKIAKEDLERDRDFFREHYGVASAFTGRLQQENKDLQFRVTIAEKQATAGVQLVRTSFEARVRKLDEELAKAKAVVKIITEKDRRTNDEVRKKAAMEPELRAAIDNLKVEKVELRHDLDTILQQRNELLFEKAEKSAEIDAVRSAHTTLEAESRSLRVELARCAARERRILKEIQVPIPPENDPDADAYGDYEDPGEQEVFVCEWATDDAGDRCNEYFQTAQDLQDHLFVANHI